MMVGDDMLLTLYDLLKHCEKAVGIYNDLAEENGMDGDVASYEYFDEKSKNLVKIINTIKEQLETNKLLPIHTYISWLNETDNESVKSIIYDSLRVIKENREYKIVELQKEIEFSDMFLSKGDNDDY